MKTGGKITSAVHLPRRLFLHMATRGAALPLVSRIARAQTYPTRPVRMIVPFPPGGQIDIIGRLIGHLLSERFGQQFFVDNRPGAGSNIGTEAALRAAADGHTLLLATVTNAVNATLFEKLNFDFIRDSAPVASINRIPLVLEVAASFPAETVPELIAYAKANPGKINIATPPKGTAPYMAAELFMMMADVAMVHVPYRGSPPMLIDLFGGQVQVAFDGISSSVEHIRAGKLRALAMATAVRVEPFSDIPTLGEFVPGYEASGWCGMVAPKNTPLDIMEKLNREINAGLADPNVKGRLADAGVTVLSGSRAEFGKLIADETEKWAKVIKFAGLKPD